MSNHPISSAHRGKGLENLLNFAHVNYFNRNTDVLVDHNGTRGHFINYRGRPKFLPHPSKSAPDYYGCIGGQFIAFDAKSTRNKTTWNLHTKSYHQWTKLLQWSRAGALCWFAVEQRLQDVLWLVSVDFKTYNEADPPRIRFDNPGDALAVPLDGGWYDWLPTYRMMVKGEGDTE